MKKLFAILSVAGVLLACNKTDNDVTAPDGSDTRSVYIQMGAAPQSARAGEPSAEGKKAELHSAALYFTDGSTDPLVYVVKKVGAGADADATIAEMAEGRKFDNIPGNVKQVYVVGNYNSSDSDGNHASVPLNSGIRLSQVKGTVLDIQQVSEKQLADGTTSQVLLTVLDSAGAVKKYSEDPDGWKGTEATPGADDLYASVTISPVNARIELAGLEYTGDKLVSLTVDGIYINKYYAKLPLDLSLTGRDVTDNGSETEKYDPEHAAFAYGAYTTLYDEVDSAMEFADGKATLGNGSNVWAYHVFGNHNPVPHVIVKLSNLKDAAGDDIGVRYLTVKGYFDGDNQRVDTFKRGKLYSVTNIKFDDSHLQIVPEPDNVELWVTVEVKEWETEIVTPEL